MVVDKELIEMIYGKNPKGEKKVLRDFYLKYHPIDNNENNGKELEGETTQTTSIVCDTEKKKFKKRRIF